MSYLGDGMMVLTDGRVRLQPLQQEDIEIAAAWYQDPEVLTFSEGPDTPPFDRDRVMGMYRYLDAHGELYLIDVKVDDAWKLIGDVTLAKDTLPIVIGEAAWRSRGIGSRVSGHRN